MALFTAERKTVIATIPVGYADGYLRNLPYQADVLIRGHRARILGRVCMDQLMVDTTEIPEAEEGDKVYPDRKRRGRRDHGGGAGPLGGGFHYEIICGIGMRVPRVYVKNGAIVGTKDYFGDEYFGFD